jgi:hypothetical protein
VVLLASRRKLHVRYNGCTFEERIGTGWWDMGIWRLKGMRGNIDLNMPCTQEEVSHILPCEGTRNWMDRNDPDTHQYIQCSCDNLFLYFIHNLFTKFSMNMLHYVHPHT